ncbi:MAG: hypothetical protein SGCHY_002763 [Lobulomycetales sp.]
MNPNAPSFNPNAASFTPSWAAKPATPAEPAKEQPETPPKPAKEQPAPALAPEQTEKKSSPARLPASDSAQNLADKLSAADLKDAKEHVNLVFIGHVDAGKSTMGGHLLLITGMVDKRTMEKYEREAKEAGRESWYLSWALDLNVEERSKGKTVEYGRGFFETDARRYTILDAPGHKNYVPSMLDGAAQADFGVLVISARKGEFETGFEKGGQTREHAMLAKTAGVKKLVVVVNKMDDPTVKWSKERYDECTSKLLPFLKSVGYNPKTDLEMMPISGFTGANMKDRLDPKVCDWYSGPSFLELLDTLDMERNYDGPLMMPITDKIKDMGVLNIAGKIESGYVREGQKILIMPNKKNAEVTSVVMEEEEVPAARSGDNVRIRVKGLEEEDVSAGFVMCSPSKPIHCVTTFIAQILIVEHSSIICAGYTAVMHANAAVEEVTLTELRRTIDKKTGKKSKGPPKFVRQGDLFIGKIETSQPVCLETYVDFPQLGRITLREGGRTVAMGKVLKLVLEDS